MQTRLILLCAAAIFFSPGVDAGERIFVQVPARLDADAPIHAAVRNACRVEMLVGTNVFQRMSEANSGIEQLEDPAKAGPDKVLQLTILSVQGIGGGGWTGSKSIMLRAELAQNGKVIGRKTFHRHSGGGMLGGVSGTCPIFERVAVALGRDIVKWLPAALSGKAVTNADTQPDSEPLKKVPDAREAAEAKQ